MNPTYVMEQLGYTQKEVKVYVLLLQTGEVTASYLAVLTKIPRTSVQVILEKLHNDGLVNFYVKRRYKYWVAENPEKLIANLDYRKELVKQVLPKLLSMKHVNGNKPIVKIFIGIEEIKMIHQDILETKKHILALLSWDEWVASFGEGFIENFIEARVKQFLRMRLLTPKTTLSMKYRGLDTDSLRETCFLSDRILVGTTTFIYGNKVALISLNEAQPTGVLIEDKNINAMITQVFEELWHKGY
jgi:sugar-specific transcriptional regulator TrmB